MKQANHFHLPTNIFFGLLSFFLFLYAIAPAPANAEVIDFTRYLSTYQPLKMTAEEKAPAYQNKFFGVQGKARLIVTASGDVKGVLAQLNGSDVVGADNYRAAGKFEVPVTLIKDNVVSVTVYGAPESSVTIRVKQKADIKLNVKARLHFNTNVRNYEASSEFYEKIGFITLMGFPDMNTQAMAKALGAKTPTAYDGSRGEEAGGYLLHGELKCPDFWTWGGDALKGGLIDLIEFTIPRNEEPPYAKLNNLGIAKAAMYTMNIAADYEYMKSVGVKFVSAPVTRSDGTTFAIFTDLDGTFYELVQKENDEEETENTHIFSLGPVTINASDFERSSAWYEMLGYKVSKKLAATDSVEVANAMGFDKKYEIDGAVLTNQIDESMVELVQWITPYNPEPPYNIPANHLGIARIAFETSDMEADVAALKAQGVEFLSDITPCCQGPDSSGSIVAFYDPDGAIIELAEQGFISKVTTFWNWQKEQICFIGTLGF